MMQRLSPSESDAQYFRSTCLVSLMLLIVVTTKNAGVHHRNIDLSIEDIESSLKRIHLVNTLTK